MHWSACLRSRDKACTPYHSNVYCPVQASAQVIYLYTSPPNLGCRASARPIHNLRTGQKLVFPHKQSVISPSQLCNELIRVSCYMERTVDDLIPLNVKTYGQGLLKLQGWMIFSCLAFLTAGLLVTYELLIINVEDQDFRDMLLDYRLTSDGVRYQHKYFANAQYCCHSDAAVFRYSCTPDSSVIAALGTDEPHCPPVVQFTCPNLASYTCKYVRDLLYSTVGLDTLGQPVNCLKTGHVLLRARAGPSYRLTAYMGSRQLPQQLSRTSDPSSVDPQLVQDFVDDVVQKYGDPMFKVPSVPLSRAVHIDGQQVLLFTHLEEATQDKWGEFGWPWELWPWPPTSSCSNTGTPAALSLEGGYKLGYQPVVNSTDMPQPTVAVTVYQSSLKVPQYQLQQHNGLLSVRALSGVNLTIGLLAPLDGCEAWQLHKPGVLALYETNVWTGSPEQLKTLRRPLTAAAQAITISVHDVSEPQPLALPHYHGELYIYVALVLGGIWMFATVPLIVMLGVLVINVQRNRGLPIFIYKYMRQYRGW